MTHRVCFSYWDDGYVFKWSNEAAFRRDPKIKERFRICYRVKHRKEHNNAA